MISSSISRQDMARAADIYYKISPFSLAAIVMLNFLLIYLNLLNLENQSTILKDIAENTEIALENQELGLNVSKQNHDLLEHIIAIQIRGNETFYKVLQFIALERNQTNSTD